MKHDLLVLLLLFFSDSSVIAQTSEDMVEKESNSMLLKMPKDKSLLNQDSNAINNRTKSSWAQENYFALDNKVLYKIEKY